jgi:hypothetical protein
LAGGARAKDPIFRTGALNVYSEINAEEIAAL